MASHIFVRCAIFCSSQRLFRGAMVRGRDRAPHHHHWNIANLMQTFENLLLQNYSTEFLDIAHKLFLGMCMSGPKGILTLLIDPTQVESKKSSQIQWPVPSINADPVDIFLGE